MTDSTPVEDLPVSPEWKIKRLEAENRVLRELIDAKIPLHERRRLPFPVFNETDDPLTQSHWPECTCVECGALHHLAKAREQVVEWEKLKDPINLHASLLMGLPAQLTKEQILHLLGEEGTRLLHVDSLLSKVTTFLTLEQENRKGTTRFPQSVAFEDWWRASKYRQVSLGQNRQEAYDGWNAAVDTIKHLLDRG
jgi:hypothetical protein